MLAAIDLHLADRKLHIVAAPGAGKTTLGLEVFKRLGRRCLILSPTRVIRNQWIARLRDFLPASSEWPAPWTSLELDQPRFLTSVTYQALHVRYRETQTRIEDDASILEGDEVPDAGEVDALIDHIRSAGIGTLILDEAHHLRDEWWKALDKLVGELEDLQLVALTATPPYDVTSHEWQKYQALCGPIDEEISVPELVQGGTLCPHQDFVWFVALSPGERQRLRAYDATVTRICDELTENAVFLGAIEDHPWMNADGDVDAGMLDYPELAFGLLIFLASHARPLPRACLESLDVDGEELPALDRRWWQVLVHAFLFHESFVLDAQQQELQTSLAKRLRATELLSRRELRLNESRPIRRMLSSAKEKIHGCLDIYQLEKSIRGDALRQVILTDFIRDELGTENLRADDESLGAWPLFRELLRGRGGESDQRHFAMLTGRLVSVHETHVASIQELPGTESVMARPAPFHPEFVVLDGDLQPLTGAVTTLLGQGAIKVLIGTRALLGEGWDAPAVNSLVLASFVGSFMLTNQMRGRAIRIDRQRPDKVSSIWHLVAVDDDSASGLGDLLDLTDRFDTFVGLDVKENRIEGGLKRLRLPMGDSFFQGVTRKLAVGSNNKEMRERLGELHRIGERWRESTASGLEHRVVPAVLSAPLPSFKSLHFAHTLRYLLLEVGCAFGSGAGFILQGVSGTTTQDYRVALVIMAVAATIGFILALPKAIKTFLLWWRHLPIDGSIKQIGLTLRDALCAADLIQTDPRRLSVVCEEAGGEVTVALIGGTFYEQSLFADSLNEVLGPIKSPRYLITRHHRGKTDYHAVPALLGARKQHANLFYLVWLKRVSQGELIYTRQAGGREVLLKARARTFSNNYVNLTERVDRWQ